MMMMMMISNIDLSIIPLL